MAPQLARVERKPARQQPHLLESAHTDRHAQRRSGQVRSDKQLSAPPHTYIHTNYAMLTAGMELIPLQSNTPITASQNLALEGRKEGWKGRKPHTTQRTEHRGDCGRIWAGQGSTDSALPGRRVQRSSVRANEALRSQHVRLGGGLAQQTQRHVAQHRPEHRAAHTDRHTQTRTQEQVRSATSMLGRAKVRRTWRTRCACPSRRPAAGGCAGRSAWPPCAPGDTAPWSRAARR